MKCPICKEEIEDGAKKCKHCGSYIKTLTRGWGIITSFLQVCTFIAAIILLYYQQEQLSLQRKSVEEISKEFVEENRPRIEIIATKIDLTDTTTVLYVDFENTGFADAEDISIYLVLKYVDSPNDTIVSPTVRYSKITKARRRTQIFPIWGVKRIDLTCLIEARYRWTIQNLDYMDKKYFLFTYEKESEKYSRIQILNDEQIQELWK